MKLYAMISALTVSHYALSLFFVYLPNILTKVAEDVFLWN